MDRPEWLESDDPLEMLESLRSCLSASEFDRYLVHYYLASCRRIWRLVPVDSIRSGVEAAQRYLDSEASPKDATYWAARAKEHGDQADMDLLAISTFNEVLDELKRPRDSFFLQAGRVRRWIDEVASIPANKLRKMVRLPPGCEPPSPRALLEDATWFALRSIDWALGNSGCRRGIEECKRFFSPHVLRQTVHQLEHSSQRP
jgi:hypothetical protein